MSFMKKLTDLANSEKGKELQAKAKKIATDPENREKLEAAKKKIQDKMGGSKGDDHAPDVDAAAKETAAAHTTAEPPDSTPGPGSTA
jgi:hypothetical protein